MVSIRNDEPSQPTPREPAPGRRRPDRDAGGATDTNRVRDLERLAYSRTTSSEERRAALAALARLQGRTDDPAPQAHPQEAPAAEAADVSHSDHMLPARRRMPRVVVAAAASALLGAAIGAGVVASIQPPPSAGASLPSLFNRQQEQADIPDPTTSVNLTGLADVHPESIRALDAGASLGPNAQAYLALSEDGRICAFIMQRSAPLAYACASAEQFDAGGMTLYAAIDEPLRGDLSSSWSLVGFHVDRDGHVGSSGGGPGS